MLTKKQAAAQIVEIYYEWMEMIRQGKMEEADKLAQKAADAIAMTGATWGRFEDIADILDEVQRLIGETHFDMYEIKKEVEEEARQSVN